MNQVYPSLAAVDLSELKALQESSDPQKTGLSVVLGAIGLVIAGMLIWAIFIRKRADPNARRYRERFLEGDEAPTGSGSNTSNKDDLPRFGRRKRRRREPRPRNPTLAETGGLPPIRDHSPPDPS